MIKIDKKSFQIAVSAVAPAVKENCLTISVGTGSVRFVSCDGSVELTYQIPCESSESFEVQVGLNEARRIGKAVNSDIRLIKKDNALRIAAGTFRATLPFIQGVTQSLGSFPVRRSLRTSCKPLRSAIDLSKFALPNTKLRGALAVLKIGAKNVQATNGSVMVVHKYESPLNDNEAIYLATTTLKNVVDGLKKMGEEVEVTYDEGLVGFRGGPMTVVVRKSQEVFGAVIQHVVQRVRGMKKTVKVERGPFEALVSGVMSTAYDDVGAVKIVVQDGAVMVEAANETGAHSVDKMTCDLLDPAAEGMSWIVDGSYVKSALAVCGGDYVQMAVTRSPVEPVLLEGPTGFVVMMKLLDARLEKVDDDLYTI